MSNKITIVIPNRNNQRYLQETINTVIKQSDKNFDFVISDNFSTDLSKEIIKKNEDFVDKLISPPKPLEYNGHLRWICTQINTEYLIFLAGDDNIHKDLILHYNKVLKESRSPSFIYTPFYYMDENSNLYDASGVKNLPSGESSDSLMNFLKGPQCNISGVAWRIDLLKEKLNTPSEIGNSIDWFLYIQMIREQRAYRVGKRLLAYRVHSQSTGNANIIKHTKNCKNMFNYLLENEDFSEAEKKQIHQNLKDFEKVISKGEVTIESDKLRNFVKKLKSPYYYILNKYYKSGCVY